MLPTMPMRIWGIITTVFRFSSGPNRVSRSVNSYNTHIKSDRISHTAIALVYLPSISTYGDQGQEYSI